jgi:hypothetical protein
MRSTLPHSPRQSNDLRGNGGVASGQQAPGSGASVNRLAQ